METILQRVDGMSTIMAMATMVLLFFVIRWAHRKIKEAPKYDVCPRCGSMLLAKDIYKNSCYSCFHLTDESAAKLRRNI